MRSTDPPLPTPSRFGRYELRAVLGRGGSGVVYEALMHGLGGFRKRVALKVLGAGDWQDDAARAALQREARVGALLSHPNVVAILDLGREQDRWYIAMELVDGHPVSTLARAGVLEPAAVLEIGIATCAGLAHIHDLRIEGRPGGLVHRDVKPQNLLVDRNGTLKVADFGIAALSSATSAHDWAGTPTWMAPEQQEGRASAASDLFALGAVMYALSARRPPFGVAEAALAASPQVEALLADPAFLAPVDAALPGLGPLLRRCLRFDPAERYPSAQALSADLRALRTRAGWCDLGALVEQIGQEHTPRRPTTAHSRSSGDGSTRAEPLFGRAAQLEELSTDLSGAARRLTLTGPGGVGKTRLARSLVTRIPDALALWIDLGDAPAADGVIGLARAVGRALAVDLVHDDPVRQLVSALVARGRPVLFFDGADAARDALAQLLDRLLTEAPNVRAVVTARGALHLREEVTAPVRPLATPDGVALFEHRVAAHLSPADRDALPALVEALDGLPLAIELAAARARSLGVPQLLERMRDRFRLLVDPARPGTSLRNALATSFALLRPWEARALAELSVFPGHFALEAAEAVVRLDEWPEAPWALDVLTVLLDASLVRLDRATSRFALLHSVRDFAAEALDPALRRAAELRHGEHYAQLGSPEVNDALHRRRPDLMRKAETELDNLRAATERAVDRGDTRVAEQAARAASAVYANRGPYAVGAALLDRVLALPDLGRRASLLVVRSGILRGLGRAADAARDLADAERLAEAQGDTSLALGARALRTVTLDTTSALASLRSLEAEARRLGDRPLEMRVHLLIGSRLMDLGDLRGARGAFEAGWSLAGRLGDPRAAALATMRLGRVDLEEGLIDDALRRFEESERGFREVGDEPTSANALENRAVALAERGTLGDAAPLLAEALQRFRLTGDRHGAANTVINLGEAALRAGRTSEARALLEESLALAGDGGWKDHHGRAEHALGLLETHLGRREEAVARFVRAARLFRDAHHPLRAVESEAQRWLIEVERGQASPGDAAGFLGAVPPRDQPFLWADLGHLLLDRGDPTGAAAALEAGRAIRAGRPIHRWADAVLGVLGSRLAAHDADLRRAARLLATADPDVREEWQRVRLHQARAEIWLAHPDPAKAAAAVRDLQASADRAGYGASHAVRDAAERLLARIRA